MKRSEVNTIMRNADAFIRQHGFHLPPFAYWTPSDWVRKGEEVHEIVENQLGWDITDFGQGEYRKRGLFLFTIRNGNPDNLKKMQGKVYAEKILVVGVGQVTPMHFHWTKMEDIINRGGGILGIQLYNSTPTEGLADSDVTVSIDGVTRTVKAGSTVMLKPEKVSRYHRTCITNFGGSKIPCWLAKSRWSTTTTATIASTNPSGDSLRLRKMRRRCTCFALTIRDTQNTLGVDGWMPIV